MQQWIELNTKMANETLASFKQFGEVSQKAAESLFAQQKEAYENFTVTAKANMEKLSAVKEQKDFLDVQNDIFQDAVSSALGEWKKTLAVTSSSHDAYRELAEDVMKTAKSNVEQTVASAKEASEAVKEAVKPTAKKAK